MTNARQSEPVGGDTVQIQSTTPGAIPPLHQAASGDAASAAALLLDRGAETGARANDGATPLRVAALKPAGWCGCCSAAERTLTRVRTTVRPRCMRRG